MDVESARTFLAIVRTGSFVRAARALNLTQTAVGARVRTLEEKLDRPLFVRNKSGAHLTPAGENFLRFATLIVQAWERARQTVALPPGRESIVAVGAELSLWNPLLRNWLVWMRRNSPELAVLAQVAPAPQLLEEVQSGVLDVAIVYAAQHRAGVVAELLFDEKLVLVRAGRSKQRDRDDGHVHVDWGEQFAANYHAAYPNQSAPAVSISYGPLALDYILATGGSGYFRMGIVRPYLQTGRLTLVPNAPEFEYSAYAVHSTETNADVMMKVRTALRAAAAEG
ncbi:MAG TPA: LysR family transcriptional regulator [Vitreimonas sp.]|nr:LysR family transcriptional regulator [Vitreimonas sp.]